MKHTIILNIILAWFSLIGSNAFAQNSGFSYAIEPVPNWVNAQNYNPKGFTDTAYGNAPYLLYTRQIELGPKTRVSYTRQVRRVDQLAGAETVAQITIDFDPTYQSLTLHSVNVIRNGQSENRLTKDSFSLYRVETEADRLIYNGTVTASIVLDDVRIGDIVEHAYSISGRNSYFQGAIQFGITQQYGIHIDRHYRSAIVPNDRTYYTRKFAGAQDMKVRIVGAKRIYEWEANQQPGLDVDSNRPEWHYGFPHFQLTDFKSWAEVGKWKHALYAPATDISSELTDQINIIKTAHSQNSERVRAVLDFVQGEIRYLGIELGSGGYVPRDPSLVFKRRFGDCKDKATLMVTMLDRMNIQASSVFVHTKNKKGLDLALPNIGAFNHVITKVEFDGKTYFLDPTKGKQFGDLDILEQPYYGLGVTAGANSAGLVTIEPERGPKDDTPFFDQDIEETFSIHASKPTIDLKVVTLLYGNRADSFLRWYNKDDLSEIQKSYLEHYQKTYPNIEVKSPIEVEQLPETAQVRVTETYTIPNAWEQDDEEDKNENMSFEANPYALSDYLPKLNKTPRTTPRALDHRSNVRHILNFKAPPDWGFNVDNTKIDNESFKFEKIESYENNLYKEVYTYASKQDHIPAENYQAIMQDRSKLGDVFGVTLSSGDHYTTTSTSLAMDGLVDTFYGLIALAFMGLLFFAGYQTAKQKYQPKYSHRGQTSPKNGPWG